MLVYGKDNNSLRSNNKQQRMSCYKRNGFGHRHSSPTIMHSRVFRSPPPTKMSINRNYYRQAANTNKIQTKIKLPITKKSIEFFNYNNLKRFYYLRNKHRATKSANTRSEDKDLYLNLNNNNNVDQINQISYLPQRIKNFMTTILDHHRLGLLSTMLTVFIITISCLINSIDCLCYSFFQSSLLFRLVQLSLLYRLFTAVVPDIRRNNKQKTFDYCYFYYYCCCYLILIAQIIPQRPSDKSLSSFAEATEIEPVVQYPPKNNHNHYNYNKEQFGDLSSTKQSFRVANQRHRRSSSSPNNYIEYNLADYCSESRWSDYPGRHMIRLEKSLKIRLPSILDFQFNETHRNRLGFYRPGIYPVWNSENPIYHHSHHYPHYELTNYSAITRNGPLQLSDESPANNRPPFVPYCLLSFTVDHGHRIYAEGLATGLISGGKDWFTETLHFKILPLNRDSQPEIGTFSISTTKNSLTLVFEQLHLAPFSFHLMLTPFRDGCESDQEYQCNNKRCIAKYLTCDHHNNCGDYSDEHLNCLARISTTKTPPDFSRPNQYDTSKEWESNKDRDSNWDPNRNRESSIDWDKNRDWNRDPNRVPSLSEVPTFPIPDPNGYDPNRPKGYDDDDSNTIPEYYDVPFPTDRKIKTGKGHTYTKPKPINGFHSATGGGFLGDLFRFNSETSNVVKVVRYLLALLVIIILVTVINFIIWCLITKRDQWFMATTSTEAGGGSPLPEQPAASSQISII